MLSAPVEVYLAGLPRAFGVHGTPQTQSTWIRLPHRSSRGPCLCSGKIGKPPLSPPCFPEVQPACPAEAGAHGPTAQRGARPAPRHSCCHDAWASATALIGRINHSLQGNERGFRSHCCCGQPAVDLRAAHFPSPDLVSITSGKV